MLDWINEIDPSSAISDWRAFVPLAIAGMIVWALWLYRCILSALRQADRQRLPHHDVGRRAVLPRGPGHPDALPGDLARAGSRPRSSSSSTSPTPRRYDAAHGAGRPGRSRRSLFKHAGKRSALGVGHPDGDRRAPGARPTPTPSGSRGCSTPCRCPFARPRRWARSAPSRTCTSARPASGAGSPTGWSTCATTTTCRRWAAPAPSPACPAAPRRTGAAWSCPVLENLENEFFLGRRCVAGDDGRLTWLVLASGYKTVHQSSARALSMFPATLPRLRQAAGALEPQLLPLLPDGALEGLAVAGAVRHQGDGAPDPADPGHHGHHPRLPVLQPPRAHAGPALLLACAWLLVGRGIRGLSRTCAGTRRRSCCCRC